MILPEQGEGRLFGYGLKLSLTKVLFPVLTELRKETPEIKARTPNGQERAVLTSKYEAYAGKGIEPEAQEHNLPKPTCRQVLVKEEEVVAEVQVVLLRITLR